MRNIHRHHSNPEAAAAPSRRVASNFFTLVAVPALVALALSAAFPNASNADPTVFGLEMGKTTEKDFQGKYKAKRVGTSKWNDGSIYEISPGEIDFRGLEKALAIFSPDGALHLFEMQLHKDHFDYLKGILDEKYKVNQSKVPSVGNKYVQYVDGLTVIEINAPHLSFDMRVTYSRVEFKTEMVTRRIKEGGSQLEKDKSNL